MIGMTPSSVPGSKCPRCGESLPADSVAGLCPRCLMVGAMQPTQAGESAAPIPTLTPEQLAPHFPQLEILECLGRGGMGVVYKARQKSLNRLVALKLLAPERVTDAQFAERFALEAQALAALNHPHIVTVHDFGVVDAAAPLPEGAPGSASVPHAKMFLFLMEFVDGVNLRQAMKAGRFTPEQALAIVPPVCEALQYAHEHGIVHRDIKPENLLLDRDGRVKIADFGIAKMLGESGTGVPPVNADTTAGTAVSQSIAAGTPQYMAPEQKAHRATDHRADIYSLGVVLYELLTGELPADKLQPPSRKVQIDVRLDEIVLRALEKSPELRYQSAVEFRTEMEAVVTARVGSRSQETSRSAARSSAGSPAIPRAGILRVLLIVALVAAAAFGVMFLRSRTALLPGHPATDANPGNPVVVAAAPTPAADLPQAQTGPASVSIEKLREELERLEKKLREDDEQLHEFQKENNIGFVREDGNAAAAFLTKLHTQLADLHIESDLLKLVPPPGDKTENASKQASVRIQISNLDGTIKIWEGKALDLAHRMADWDKLRSQQDRTRGIYLRTIVAIRCARVNQSPAKAPGGATFVSPRFVNPVFGPVIEHPFPMQDGEAWGWNLASGKLMKSTEARPLSFDSTGDEKLRVALVDLYEAPKTEGRMLKALDAALVPLGDDGWNATPLVAMMQLEEAGRLLMVRAEVSASGGENYAFVTREGATGVLQIVNGTPRKLRYKLVQEGPAKTAK